MNRLISLSSILLLALTLVACGGGSPDQQTASTQANQEGASFEAHFDVIAQEGTKKYDPMSLTVTGSQGTITVTNKLDVKHGFVIREFDIKEAVPAGETMSFDVSDVAPGQYQVDCHLHSAHKEATLIVKEAGS